MKTHVTLILALAFLTLCAVIQAQSPSTVLVVANAKNANSVALAEYYLNARSIPNSNLLLLHLPAKYTPDNVDTMSLADYSNLIAAPIYAMINLLPHIDYIVLCRNLPVIIADTQGSVDSALAGQSISEIINPFYKMEPPFNSSTYGMYLVTRLDGWSWNDAFGLVVNSLQAVTGNPIFIDEDPNKNTGLYAPVNPILTQAAVDLETMGVPTILSQTQAFWAPAVPLGGYYSWGSNDSTFSYAAYDALQFAPGAIAETLVSTSAFHLRTYDANANQSQIAQLIEQGVTGIKGYVAEPSIYADAYPTILFPYYTSGANLAESFYAASNFTGWRDVVIGDPLCSPYSANPY